MISIVVPVYKSEKTLGGCLDSLLAQTYQDIEVICVIDGSPDACGEICDAYAERDSRVKSIKRENGGVSSARNRGIDEAQGEYLMFVDSDDSVEPDYCEKMWQAHEESGAELVICGFHHWYVGRDVEKRPKTTGIFNPSRDTEMILELYQTGFLNMPWNKLFRKELAGSFDTSLSLGEDLLFNIDYLQNCEKMAVIDSALIHYIQEEKGNTLSSKKREDKLDIAKKVCRGMQSYYEKLTGDSKLHPVIAGKFVMEFLDDCMKLPFDESIGRKEKLASIRSLTADALFMEANDLALVTGADYRVLQWCFSKGLWKMIYPVCVLRKWVVVAARWIWKR